MNIDNLLDELINTLLIIRKFNYELHGSNYYETYEHIIYIFTSYDKLYFPDRQFLSDIITSMKEHDKIPEIISNTKSDHMFHDIHLNFADNEWIFKCIRHSLLKNKVYYTDQILNCIRDRYTDNILFYSKRYPRPMCMTNYEKYQIIYDSICDDLINHLVTYVNILFDPSVSPTDIDDFINHLNLLNELIKNQIISKNESTQYKSSELRSALIKKDISSNVNFNNNFINDLKLYLHSKGFPVKSPIPKIKVIEIMHAIIYGFKKNVKHASELYDDLFENLNDRIRTKIIYYTIKYSETDENS